LTGRACTARDLHLIAVLDGAPAWATPDGQGAGTTTPPQEISDWGAFAAAVARRYRGRIAAYQIWDEPNLSAHWGGQYVDPAAYTALLREGAIRVQEADPGAIILLAALAPTIEAGPLNLNEIDFLRQVIDAGGRHFFDAVALQPYGFADPPNAPGGSDRLNFARAAWVRRQMVRMGLGDVPVWATSWGWSAPLPGLEETAGPWPIVDEERQVRYTFDAIALARREWPWMGPMVLQTWQPAQATTEPRWGFALRDAAGQSRALYAALAQDATEIGPLHVGQYVPDPREARYVGAWRFSPAGADPPRGADEAQRNAVIEFEFWGTSLDLTVRRGDYWGVLYLSIDGAPAHGLLRDERGHAYLILHDPLSSVERVTVARGLSRDAPHRVEIVAHGGWGQWPLVGWTVYGPAAGPRARGAFSIPLSLAVLAALAALGQAYVSPELLAPLYRLAGGAFRRYRALPEPVPVALTAAVALAFYFAPWAPLRVPMLIALGCLFFLRIDLGLASVAFALPFYLRSVSLFGRPVSVVELGVWLCAAAWTTARLLDLARVAAREGHLPLLYRVQRLGLALHALPRTLLRLPAGDLAMTALVLLAALSLNWAQVRPVAARELRTVFIESALFYALIRLALKSRRAHWRLVEGWLAGGVAIALIGIGQAVVGQNLISAEGVWRVRGLYGSPNNLALYLERAWPVLLALAWQGRDRVRRIACGVGALVVSIALVLTTSRGALLLGLPAALLALGLAQRRRRTTWAVLGTLLVLALLVTPLALGGRFRSTFDFSAGTGFYRLKLWRSALAMIVDRPLTGVGLDNFLYAYRTRYILPSAWAELDLSHPHNLLLDTWTRLGLGGVIVVAWLFVALLRMVLRRFRETTGDLRALYLGMIAATAALLAHGLVDHALYLVDLAFVMALMVALAHAEPRT